MTQHIRLSFDVEWENQDLLIAFLSQLGGQAFEQKANRLITSFESHQWKTVEAQVMAHPFIPKKFEVERVEEQNWNKIWEESYKPIEIDSEIIVRASFHENRPEFPIQIIVDPKMAFGTGHHETTWLMLKAQLKIDLKGKRLLDMGCGTGILAIAANKLGCMEIVAMDNDPKAVDSAKQNAIFNKCDPIRVILGDKPMATKSADGFDIVLANINRESLKKMKQDLYSSLHAAGQLLLSGFYAEDVEDMLEAFCPLGFQQEEVMLKNKWALLRLKKT